MDEGKIDCAGSCEFLSLDQMINRHLTKIDWPEVIWIDHSVNTT
jgi:hypothetical protein